MAKSSTLAANEGTENSPERRCQPNAANPRPSPLRTKSWPGRDVLGTWVFVMTLAWSRHQYAEIVRDQKVETWLGCHRLAFEFFGGVPARIFIDNPKCAITKACYHDPEVQRAYAEIAEGYGFLISPYPPRDPQKKAHAAFGVKRMGDLKGHFYGCVLFQIADS